MLLILHWFKFILSTVIYTPPFKGNPLKTSNSCYHPVRMCKRGKVIGCVDVLVIVVVNIARSQILGVFAIANCRSNVENSGK